MTGRRWPTPASRATPISPVARGERRREPGRHRRAAAAQRLQAFYGEEGKPSPAAPKSSRPVDAGADVNWPTGWLHAAYSASAAGHTEIVAELLAANAMTRPTRMASRRWAPPASMAASAASSSSPPTAPAAPSPSTRRTTRRSIWPPTAATTTSPPGSAAAATGARRSTTSRSSRPPARVRCCAPAPTSTPPPIPAADAALDRAGAGGGGRRGGGHGGVPRPRGGEAVEPRRQVLPGWRGVRTRSLSGRAAHQARRGGVRGRRRPPTSHRGGRRRLRERDPVHGHRDYQPPHAGAAAAAPERADAGRR